LVLDAVRVAPLSIEGAGVVSEAAKIIPSPSQIPVPFKAEQVVT